MDLTVDKEGEAGGNFLEGLVLSAQVTDAVLEIGQHVWALWVVGPAEQLAQGGMSREVWPRVPRRETAWHGNKVVTKPLALGDAG